MGRTTDHKEGKAVVKVVYFTSKRLAHGEHPFLVRIAKEGKRKYISTGLSLHPKFWNAQKNEVRKSYPEPHRSILLTELEKWKKKYQEAATTLALSDEVYDVADVASKAIEERKSTRRVNLLFYMDGLITDMKAARQLGNAQVYKDNRNQLARFIEAEYGIQDVAFDRVTVSFCQRWETTLRAAEVTDVSLSQRFRTLRAVLNRAISEGVAKPESYPFARNRAERHKFSISKFKLDTTKRAISRDEVRRIEALELDSPRLQLAKDVFLFSFYCGGINFVDLSGLRWRNFTTDAEGKQRLSYVRQKTGGKFSLRLLPPIVAMLERYRPSRFTTPDSYVFPVLDEHLHKTPAQIKNRQNRIIGQVNQDLKDLGKLVGINTPLTTYVARHSFATNLKRSGVATAVISEAMGHKSEGVTAVYLDSFATEIVDSAFENLL